MSADDPFQLRRDAAVAEFGQDMFAEAARLHRAVLKYDASVSNKSDEVFCQIASLADDPKDGGA